MNERDFQKLIDNHNPPPETPRDRMWQEIRSHRQTPRTRLRLRIWPMAAALAAMLVIGFGIGRWALPRSVIPQQVISPPEVVYDTQTIQLQPLTVKLLDRADALLTEFRLEDVSPDQLDNTTRWAGQMLTQTRLLQGSPQAGNPELASLLADLELVLAQIVTIDPNHYDRDVAWIRSGLNQRATVSRLRSTSGRPDPLDSL